MPIKQLLSEWSELEPEKCSHVGDMYAIRGWTLSDENDLTERLVISEIQNAIQEAIESHGWNWYVGRFNIEKGVYYKSRIAYPPSEQEEAPTKLNVFLSTHSATHVLLQAYIQALSVASVGTQVPTEDVQENADDDNLELHGEAFELVGQNLAGPIA